MTGDRALLDRMNAQIEQLYREGRDHDAHVLAERANALARSMFRKPVEEARDVLNDYRQPSGDLRVPAANAEIVLGLLDGAIRNA